MATFQRPFANLSRYQQAAVQPQANVMDQFVQALNQGISFAQLPQTLQAEAQQRQQNEILNALKVATAQKNLYDMQHPDEALANEVKKQITLNSIQRQLPGAEAALPEFLGQTIPSPGVVGGEIAGDLTGITERPAAGVMGAPTTPMAVNGIQTGFNYNPQVEAARIVAESAKEAAKQKAKYDAMGIPTQLIKDADNNWLVVPMRQFGDAPNQATGLTYADTGGGVTAPEKAAPQVKMIERSDGNGDLMERPVTGGAWNYALTPDGKRVNVGIANKFFETGGGMMTAPSKSPGGTAPTASPLMTNEQPLATSPAGGGFVPVEGTAPTTPEPETPKPRQVRAPPKSSFKDEQSLRKEFDDVPAVKEFLTIQPQFARMNAAIEESKRGGSLVAVDQTLINTFNKMIDSKSVVMVSEYARTANDISIVNQVKGKMQKLLSGGAGLTNEEREAIQRMAKSFYEISRSGYDDNAKYYSGLASGNGWDPNRIVRPISNSLGTPKSTGTRLKLISVTPSAP